MSDMPPPPPPNRQPPPGYVPYGSFGIQGGQTKPINTLGKWLAGLTLATLLAQVLVVLIQFTLRDDARDFLSNGDTDFFDEKFATFLLLALILGAAGIAQIVLLCVWTFRMAKNHLAIGRYPQSFSAGATIAVNLLGGCTLGIVPFFMWREMWQGSNPDAAPGDPSWKQRAVSALVPVHLALVLAGVVLNVVAGATRGFGLSVSFGTDRNDLAEALDSRLGVVVLAGLIGAATTVVFFLIVRQLTARHARVIGEV